MMGRRNRGMSGTAGNVAEGADHCNGEKPRMGVIVEVTPAMPEPA